MDTSVSDILHLETMPQQILLYPHHLAHVDLSDKFTKVGLLE